MRKVSRIYASIVATVLAASTLIALVAGLGPVAAAEAPVVQILSPQAGTINNNTPLLEYTVSDSSAKVVVTLCGRVRDMQSGQGFWILSPGSHVLRVEATNAQGLTGYSEVSFYIPCDSCNVEPGGDHTDNLPGSSGGGSGGGETTSTTLPVTPTTTLPPVKKTVSFTDVSSSAWHKRYIDMLVARGIISGYPDGTFRPDNNVTRAEFAKMVCIAKDWVPGDPPAISFNDVATDHWACGYIENVKSNVVIVGYPDGSYGPGKSITRAEIAAIVSRLLNLEAGTGSFKDISSHWAQGFICSCYGAGIINGYNDNTFKPNNPATRAEAAKMIAQTFDH
ncbi:MAG TPA: hypothetical protein DE036_05105 [Actinobacteria bacterium]|nr:hypothetical protein [Actinomycetota bacterium]